MDGEQHTHPHYLHHQQNGWVNNIREAVFGVQDGMVSTLGAVTGVAIGSASTPTIILAGVAIIAVESVSMAIGSYVSSDSEEKLAKRMVAEEKEEIRQCVACEVEEAETLFVRDGWSPTLARAMAQEAEENPKLLLKEMMYRELGVDPYKKNSSLADGITMFFAYIVGGLVPLIPYFFFPLELAMPISVPVTLAGLFILGTIVARYTAQNWIRSGIKLLVFGSIAVAIGYAVGTFVGV
jgi:vacuolar iron transporter family protein